MYISTKIFKNYTVALRQWKSVTHCRLTHGYSFKFKIWFTSESLDDTNWVVDFGGFSHSGLKEWMNSMFDHTILIEKDDPYRDIFETLAMDGVMKVVIMEKMGCESLAKLVYDKFNDTLSKQDAGRCRVIKVECFENDTNSAIYQEDRK